MADLDNDIDRIFKSRFEDLKDHSADPARHWGSVQSALSETAVASAGSASTSFGVLKIAASVASFALITSISGDRLNSLHKDVHVAEEYSQPEVQQKSIAEESNSGSEMTNTSKAHSLEASEKEAANVASYIPTSNDDPEIDSEIIAAHSGSSSEIYDRSRLADTIARMSSLMYTYTSPTVEDPAYRPENPIIDRWNNDHIWFFRGGARAGMGESNSSAVDAEWAINPSFAFGYGFSITDKSFMSVEIGLIRRSGNGIERMRQRNIDPEVASFANTANNELSVQIHNGLIATQMDYIHFPIQYNYLATENWNVSVGGFVDYLIAARNQSVVVYNTENYIAVATRLNEVSSLDGLKKMRYGAILGAERTLSKHFSTYAQVMVPINDPIDQEGGFESFGETNRLIDGQFGLKYNF